MVHVHRRIGALLAICAATVALTAAPSALADSEIGPDTRARATHENISPEEAERKYGWTTDFNLLANTAAKNFPSTYADAAVTGDTTATIWFKGDPPSDIVQAASTLPGATITVIGGAKESEARMRAEQWRIHDIVTRHEAVETAASRFDALAGTIYETIRLKPAIAAQGTTAALTELRDLARPASGMQLLLAIGDAKQEFTIN